MPSLGVNRLRTTPIVRSTEAATSRCFHQGHELDAQKRSRSDRNLFIRRRCHRCQRPCTSRTQCRSLSSTGRTRSPLLPCRFQSVGPSIRRSGAAEAGPSAADTSGVDLSGVDLSGVDS